MWSWSQVQKLTPFFSSGYSQANRREFGTQIWIHVNHPEFLNTLKYRWGRVSVAAAFSDQVT